MTFPLVGFSPVEELLAATIDDEDDDKGGEADDDRPSRFDFESAAAVRRREAAEWRLGMMAPIFCGVTEAGCVAVAVGLGCYVHVLA